MNKKMLNRAKRKMRIRAVIIGSEVRPRISFYRSQKYLYVQIIDDEHGKTIIGKRSDGKNLKSAKKLGLELALLAKKKSITKIVFDRGGNKFHGVVKAFADTAREGGLQF